MKNIFRVKGEGEKYDFICNKESGKWVLIDKREDEKICNSYFNSPFIKKIPEGTSLIVLNTTQACNLTCHYCYVENKSQRRMDFDLGKLIIDKCNSLNQEKVTIVFHGSEPLLNFEFIKNMIEYGKDKQKIEFSVQTNCTLLTDKIVKFFYENNVSISLSLDGTEELHNKQRPYPNFHGSYKDVIKSIELLKKYNYPIEIITVVTKYNVNYLLEILEHYGEIEIDKVLFSPVTPLQKEKRLVPDNEILFEKNERTI